MSNDYCFLRKRGLLPIFLGMLLAGAATAKPPTVDPTYGLAIPRRPVQKAGTLPDWIWTAQTADNQTIYARAVLNLRSTPHMARIAVTADDEYTLSVNGHPVSASATGGRQYAWQHVQVVNVTRFLRAGRNVVALLAHNGAAAAGAILQLDIDGKPALVTDKKWHVLDSPNVPAGWNTAEFDDSAWASAAVIAPLGEGAWGRNLDTWLGNAFDVPYLAHLAMPPVALEVLTGSIAGAGAVRHGVPLRVTIAPSPDPSTPPALLVDFGRELAGRVQIAGTQGEPVTLSTGEVRPECLRTELPNDNSGPFPLTLAGRKPVSTPYTAFRYARLVFPGNRPVTITGITCDHKYYPVQYKGAFDCSDPLLTRIWYAGAYTAHLCMQEDIWDAPKRDRQRWMGDLHVSAEVINNVFADKFLLEQTMTRLRRSTQGGRPDTALPTGEINEIPGYTAAWFCGMADFYRHVGDKAYLQSQHALLLSQLAYEKTNFDANALFTNPHAAWDYCDWSPGFSSDTPVARETTNLFLIKAVRDAVFLLRALHDTTNADTYSAWAETLTMAAQRAYGYAPSGTYGTHLQENAMAIVSGVATPAQAQSIYRTTLKTGCLTSPIAAGGKTASGAPMTPYYGHYVLQALGTTGNTQDGLDLVRLYWGDMLRRGTNTWWEGYDPKMPADLSQVVAQQTSMSYCHGWGAGPTSYLTEYILGIRPTDGGFKTAVIAPHLGDLAWAAGTVPTPQGLIHIRAAKKGTGYTLSVTLPRGVDAQVGVPGRCIMVNGARATATPHAGTAYLHLSRPGTYQITSSGG